ncbi:MAG: FkbM family methyltransferase [Bacteroidota bacterium]
MQNLLVFVFKVSRKLMGIGTGAGPAISGERKIIKLVLKLFKSDPLVIFDGGANQGQFTVMTLDNMSINIDFEIHCFEPAKRTFQILNENVGEYSEIRLNNVGLGREIENKTLFYDKEGSGIASLTKRSLRHHEIEYEIEEEVRITTIDNYCMENNIDQIHLLKLDVEGFEMDALYGAQEILRKAGIRLISFEFGGASIDSKYFFKEIYYFLSDRNFQIFRISPNGYLFHITRYTEDLEQFQTTNYLAQHMKD